jgi:hypothetical protein
VREAVLLHHPYDVAWARSTHGAKVELIAHEDAIRWAAGDRGIPAFFPASDGASRAEDEVKFLTLNWHRDDQGRDLAFRDGLSLAQVISGSAWIAIASLYREYHALAAWLRQLDVLHVSCNEPERFLTVCAKFGDHVRVFDPGHRMAAPASSCLERQFGPVATESRRGRVARAVQRPIRGMLRGKSLFLRDWTSLSLARRTSTGVLVNDPRLWRGAYFSRGHLRAAEALCPAELHAPTDPGWLRSVLARGGAEWPAPLVELVSDELVSRYAKLRPYLARTIAAFRDLLATYAPKRVILPGESYEPYTIAAQLARAVGAKPVLCLDGYPVLMGSGVAPVYRDPSGADWLFEQVAAYGQANWDHLKTRGLRDDQLILLRPPILDHHVGLRAPDARFDAMVMTWTSYDNNPSGLAGCASRFVVETLDLLAARGFTRLAVKIKSPSELTALVPVLQACGWSGRVEILSGRFHEHVLRAERVVGGFSSGTLETALHGIPYYVHEPFENGYADSEIATSTVVSPARVSRDAAHLSELLRDDRGSVTASLAYLTDGPVELPW